MNPQMYSLFFLSENAVSLLPHISKLDPFFFAQCAGVQDIRMEGKEMIVITKDTELNECNIFRFSLVIILVHAILFFGSSAC